LQLGRLAGLIPTELGRLVGLQVFGWQNQLEVAIPAALTPPTNLQRGYS
jgi:hypothetical protein